MLMFETCCRFSTTKITRSLRPYRHYAILLLLLLIILGSWLHVSSLKDELLSKLEESASGNIEDVDLDSSLYEDGNKKGVDFVLKRNRLKDKELMKHGGFAPWKKLKLATDEPAVEIPEFFPKVEFNCRTNIKRVAGAWITHLKDPGDAQHRHRTDSWNLCFDDKLTRFNAFRPRGRTDTSCVVYSFGMDTNWSFEEDMLLHNCQVHMFDGSKENNAKNIIRRRVKNLTIHRTHLSHQNLAMNPLPGKESDATPDQKQLGTIMSELGHDRVDVIKIDIEGGELRALESASKALVEGVDQILVEVHMHVSEHAHDSAKPEHFEQETVSKWEQFFKALRSDGYRVYDIRAKGTDREGNILPRHHYSCCYRLAFIKTPYRMKDNAAGAAAGDQIIDTLDLENTE